MRSVPSTTEVAGRPPQHGQTPTRIGTSRSPSRLAASRAAWTCTAAATQRCGAASSTGMSSESTLARSRPRVSRVGAAHRVERRPRRLGHRDAVGSREQRREGRGHVGVARERQAVERRHPALARERDPRLGRRRDCRQRGGEGGLHLGEIGEEDQVGREPALAREVAQALGPAPEQAHGVGEDDEGRLGDRPDLRRVGDEASGIFPPGRTGHGPRVVAAILPARSGRVRASSRSHLRWCRHAQPPVTVPRVIARSVPASRSRRRRGRSRCRMISDRRERMHERRHPLLIDRDQPVEILLPHHRRR